MKDKATFRSDAYIVNAFSDNLAEGNPAGVIFHTEPIPDDVMLTIAADLGRSETAFVKQEESDTYRIRWFSPKKEMPLCGHATLAAAKVIFDNSGSATVTFTSAAGAVAVRKRDDGSISMVFPLDHYEYIPHHEAFADFFPGIAVTTCIRGTETKKVILIVEDTTDIETMRPDFAIMVKNAGICDNGIGITKKSDIYDFESRYFHPWVGVNEDPVTGSVHTVLARYWGDTLHKNALVARQASYRPGILTLENHDDKVIISGKARIVIEGQLRI